MKLMGMFAVWKETPYATVRKMIMAVADATHTNNSNAPRCCSLHRGAFLMGWRGLEMLAKEECSTERSRRSPPRAGSAGVATR
jgi:hypothetical protein